MANLKLSKKIHAYRRLPATFTRSHAQALQKVLFPGVDENQDGILLGVTTAGNILFKQLEAYQHLTKIDAKAAYATAATYLRGMMNAAIAAEKTGQLPTEFLSLFQGLKPNAPIASIASDTKGSLHYWQVFFSATLIAGEHEYTDELLQLNRQSRLDGPILDEWIKIDVGHRNEVIGVIIQRRPVEAIQPAAGPQTELPAHRDPQVSFMPREKDDELHPFVADPEWGLLPLEALQADLRDAQGRPCDAFGRPYRPQPVQEPQTSSINTVLRALEAEPEPVLLASTDASLGFALAKAPDPEELWAGLKLRVTRDDVGFHGKDVGILPRGQKPPKDSYIYPSLMEGEVLEVIELSPSGWIKVRRLKDGREGYVDWRYVEVIPFELREVEISALKDATAKRIANSICAMIKKKLVPPTFWESLFNTYIDIGLNTYKFREIVPLGKILEVLDLVSKTYTLESFALVCIYLRQQGCLQKIIAVVDADELKQHWQLILKMCYVLPLENVTDLLEKIAKQEMFTQMWKERKSYLRYPTWDNWNPFDKAGVKNRIAEAIHDAVQNEDLIVGTFADNLEYFLRVKYFEIDHYLKKGEDAEIRRLMIEADMMTDLGLEMLFSTDPKNSYLKLPGGYTLVDLWNLMKQPIGVPNIYLLADGTATYSVDEGTAPEMKEIFCHKTKTLMTSLPTPIISTFQGAELDAYNAQKIACNGAPTPPSQSSTTATQPSASEEGKRLAKQLVKVAANRIKDFLTSDLYDQYVNRPEFLPVINNVYVNTLRPMAANRLTLSTRIQNQFKDQATANRLLTADYVNRTHDIIDKLTWIDIARIWYYELGSQSQLGQEKKELVFSAKSSTTKDIRKHPSMVRVVEYVKARVNAGNYDTVLLQVKYDVDGFWKAIVANDVTFNLLGSFAVTVKRKPATNEAEFTVNNTLSMESASRFKKDENATQSRSAKIDGLLESKERDTKDTLESGGNLRCIWRWDEPMP